jgi:four helix bundle protein
MVGFFPLQSKGDTGMVRDFRNIITWRKADDLAVEVYRVSGRVFPDYERFGLRAQIRSSAVSVAANLAEGSGRATVADFRRFLFIAQGSLSEVEYYIHLARRLGYFSAIEHDRLAQLRSEVGRTLAGLIRSTARTVRAG